MKITVCDKCKTEIDLENQVPLGKFATIAYLYPVHWDGLRDCVDTAEDLCKYCLIDIIKELDDRPKVRVQE